jgi:hypothetical protein
VPSSPYRLLWFELAERQYLDFPDDTRALVDERLTLLESDPAGLPTPTYDAASDQWSAPIAERGPDALRRRAPAGHRHRATPHCTLTGLTGARCQTGIRLQHRSVGT